MAYMVLITPEQMKAVKAACKDAIECTAEFEYGGGWVYYQDVSHMMGLRTFENAIQWIHENSKETGMEMDIYEDAGTSRFGVWMCYTYSNETN